MTPKITIKASSAKLETILKKMSMWKSSGSRWDLHLFHANMNNYYTWRNLIYFTQFLAPNDRNTIKNYINTWNISLRLDISGNEEWWLTTWKDHLPSLQSWRTLLLWYWGEDRVFPQPGAPLLPCQLSPEAQTRTITSKKKVQYSTRHWMNCIGVIFINGTYSQ